MQARKKIKWTDNGYVFVNEVAVKKMFRRSCIAGTPSRPTTITLLLGLYIA